MQPTTTAYQTSQARQESFNRARILGTGLRSRAKKNFLSWPHARPTPEDMAAAGFFFEPSKVSHDRVKCFLCHYTFDQWKAEDDPALEHVSLSPTCPWALLCSKAGAKWASAKCATTLADTEFDPYAPSNYAGRLGTFVNWPYEKKRGWRPKSVALAQAGFHYVPQFHNDDTTECALCGVTLNGWEPKDDPVEEHRRRRPECLFFTSAPQSVEWTPNMSPKKVLRRSPVQQVQEAPSSSHTSPSTDIVDITALECGTPLQECDFPPLPVDESASFQIVKTVIVPEPANIEGKVLSDSMQTGLVAEDHAEAVSEVKEVTAAAEDDVNFGEQIEAVESPEPTNEEAFTTAPSDSSISAQDEPHRPELELPMDGQVVEAEVLPEAEMSNASETEPIETPVVGKDSEPSASEVAAANSDNSDSAAQDNADLPELALENVSSIPDDTLTESNAMDQKATDMALNQTANIDPQLAQSESSLFHDTVEVQREENANSSIEFSMISSRFKPREIIDLANASHVSAADYSMATGEPDTAPLPVVQDAVQTSTKRLSDGLESAPKRRASADMSESFETAPDSLVGHGPKRPDQSVAKRSFLAAWMHSTPSALKNVLSPRRLFGHSKASPALPALPSPLPAEAAATKPATRLSQGDYTFAANGLEFSMIGAQLIAPDLEIADSSVESANSAKTVKSETEHPTPLVLPSLDTLLEPLPGLLPDTLSQLAVSAQKSNGQGTRQWLEQVADRVGEVMKQNTERLIEELEKQRKQAIDAVLAS